MYIKCINSKDKYLTFLKFILVATILFLLLIFSKNNFEEVKSSINIFINSIFPSLFPFILFSELIVSSGLIDTLNHYLSFLIIKIFKVPKAGSSSILIGFLCGYPMGAKTVDNLYSSNKISQNSAKYLLTFVNNCNPVFIISTVGVSMFNSIKVGIILLISHYISAVTISFITRFKYTNIIHENCNNLKYFNKNIQNNTENITYFEILKTSILKTFLTLGNIFAFVIIFNLLFSLISLLFNKLNVDSNILKSISGIFEVTKGVLNVSTTNYSLKFKIIISSFMLGFSGLCILFQIYSCIPNIHVPFRFLIKYKLVHAVISAFFSYILLFIIKLETESTNVNQNIDSYNISNISYTSFLEKISITYINSIFLIIAFLCIFTIARILINKNNKRKNCRK